MIKFYFYILLCLSICIFSCTKQIRVSSKSSNHYSVNGNIVADTFSKPGYTIFSNKLVPINSCIDIQIYKQGVSRYPYIRFRNLNGKITDCNEVYVMNHQGEMMAFELEAIKKNKLVINISQEDFATKELNIKELKALYNLIHSKEIKVQFKGTKSSIYTLSQNHQKGLKEIIEYFFD